MMFNNQIFNSGATNPSNGLQGNQLLIQPVVYGQGKHQELLDQIQHESAQGVADVLRSIPNTDQLINVLDPTFKQSAFYKAVNITNPLACLEVCQLFFDKGGKITGKDVHGQSPLFYLCKEGKIEALKLFLENGADINETDNFRQTPLFYASRDGKTEIVRVMVQNGANPNHKDKVDQTPLFYAARDNRLETCKVLIELGSDLNLADQKKQTALFFARKSGHKDIDDYLVMHGAINTKDGILRQSDMRKTTKIGEIISSQSEVHWSDLRKQYPAGKEVD